MNYILDKVKSHKINPAFPIYSLYTSGTENCEALESKLRENGYDIADRLQVGSTIGTHVGPGVYAVLFVEEYKTANRLILGGLCFYVNINQ